MENIEFNLQDCVTESMRSLALRAHQKGLELVCRVAPDVPQWLVGDPLRLRQVLLTLVGNAIKFTRGGEVILNIEKATMRDNLVELHSTVRDSGVGIAEDHRAMLFEAFSQADSSIRRRYGGTGSGLAISLRLVNAMGGRIWLESAEGAGSTFHFTARFNVAAQKHEQEPRGQRTRSWPPLLVTRQTLREARRKLRILVAEDNTVNQKVMLSLLRKMGHRVTIANDGKETLDLVNSQAFDLVFMDVQMPEIDGFAATMEIRKRQQGSGRRLPIVAMTAHALKGDRERCLTAGMDGYISKPVNFDRVQEELDRLCAATGGAAPQVALQPSWDRDQALSRMGGDEDLLREILSIFLQEHKKCVAQLRGAIPGRDFAAARTAAHTLKGELGYLAAGPALKALEGLRECALRQDVDGMQTAFQRLNQELLRLESDLNAAVEGQYETSRR